MLVKHVCEKCGSEFMGGPMAKICDKCKDVTGQKIGEWQVLERVTIKNDRDNFLCRCSCGKEKIVRGHNLRSGNTRSCGHVLNPALLALQEDLTGRQFSELTVLKYAESKNQNRYWLCRCSCGKEKLVKTEDLKSGNTRSCGHLQKDSVAAVPYCGTNPFEIACKKRRKNNTSGYAGVCWNTQRQKWMAYIKFRRKQYYLGFYEKVEDAATARKAAEEKIHGSFLKWYAENYPEQWKKIQERKDCKS